MSVIEGKRILLTRTTADNAVWAKGLRQRGAVPVGYPCLALEILPTAAKPLRAALRRSSWLVLCSRHAVRAVADQAPIEGSAEARLACVGPVTAVETERLLGPVALVAPGGTAQSLARVLLERLTDTDTVLLPGAERGRDEFAEEFQAAGRDFERLAVYRTRAVDPADRPPLPPADAIFFASPSAVEAFALGPPPPADALLVSLGPSTSAAVHAAGWTLAAESTTRDLGGMIEAAIHAWTEHPSPTEP